MTTASPAILAIGLDSCDFGLIQKWAASSQLPHLSKLLKVGASGQLLSPVGFADDAAWASVATSSSPAEHGRFFYRHLEKASYRYSMYGKRALERKNFWQILDEQGYRCAILDVPKCSLTPMQNGIQLSDWIVHGRDAGTRSSPEDFAKSVVERYGVDIHDDPMSPDYVCGGDQIPDKDSADFLRSLLETINSKKRLCTDLIASREWDLFMVVFKESHCAGHQFWKPQESGSTNVSECIGQYSNDHLLKVYQALDTAIGELVHAVGANTQLLIFSDLSMGTNNTGQLLLEDLIADFERSLQGKISMALRPVKALLGRAMGKVFPGKYIYSKRQLLDFYVIDHNEMCGAIRLNVRKREPRGRIYPGENFNNVCENISSFLMNIINVETGEPAIDRVVRVDTLHRGVNQRYLPDLLVFWNRKSEINSVKTADNSFVYSKSQSHLRSGNHLSNGFYILSETTNSATNTNHPNLHSLEDIGPGIANMLKTHSSNTG